MLATASSNSQHCSSRSLTFHSSTLSEQHYGRTTQLNSKHQPLTLVKPPLSSLAVEEHPSKAHEATQESELVELQATVASALAAQAIAQQQYQQAQAEATVWQRRLQTALENNCSEQVYRIACCEKACAERVKHLKAAIDSYNVSINLLHKQLTFWES